MTLRTQHPVSPAAAPKTCQYTAVTHRGEYQVQISWPLSWDEDRQPPEALTEVPTIYLVDGNAYFFTASEVARRLTFTLCPPAIVVAIGYPLTDAVYHLKRRAEDFTPPCKRGFDAAPPPRQPLQYGGAADFLAVLESDIVPYVEGVVFPHLPLANSRRMLFGHSFGGLFTLHTLFTRPTLFDTFAAASPSIWFNECSIVQEQEQDFWQGSPDAQRPRLLLTYGSLEQDPNRRPGEPEDKYEERQRLARGKHMKDHARALADRMQACERVRDVDIWEFDQEDHGGAAVCGLQRALGKFLSGET